MDEFKKKNSKEYWNDDLMDKNVQRKAKGKKESKRIFTRIARKRLKGDLYEQTKRNWENNKHYWRR